MEKTEAYLCLENISFDIYFKCPHCSNTRTHNVDTLNGTLTIPCDKCRNNYIVTWNFKE